VNADELELALDLHHDWLTADDWALADGVPLADLIEGGTMEKEKTTSCRVCGATAPRFGRYAGVCVEHRNGDSILPVLEELEKRLAEPEPVAGDGELVELARKVEKAREAVIDAGAALREAVEALADAARAQLDYVD
jgi:hypothetical protein